MELTWVGSVPSCTTTAVNEKPSVISQAKPIIQVGK